MPGGTSQRPSPWFSAPGSVQNPRQGIDHFSGLLDAAELRDDLLGFDELRDVDAAAVAGCDRGAAALAAFLAARIGQDRADILRRYLRPLGVQRCGNILGLGALVL